MKRTKTKLVSSIVTLLVCFAMLVGSTFAWFTDSASTGVNKIQAGNLDIKVEYSKDGTTWASIEEATTLFTSNLWEPGHTEYVYLRVKNAGTLALKYKVMVSPVSENGGINVYDQNFKLSDYLKFGTTNPDTSFTGFADRAAARSAIGAGVSIDNDGLTKEKTINAGETEQYLALVVYMPETVGNEANYKSGTVAPTIDLGIKVVATQDSAESDSFDNQYDKYATYPDAKTVSDVTEFANVIQNAKDGDVIALADDMMLTVPMTISKGITIVGNGNTISGKPITTLADVTFKNVKLSKPGNTNKNASLVYAYNGCEELVFDGCTFSDPQWEAMQITSKDLKSVTITNCTFTAANVEGAANSSYGSKDDEAIRFIHIQPNGYPVVNVKIANNKFLNCNKIADGVVGIYYVSEDSTITVGGNTFEGLEIENGNSWQLSVGWPEVQALKTVSYWTGEAKTFVIDSMASNPLN